MAREALANEIGALPPAFAAHLNRGGDPAVPVETGTSLACDRTMGPGFRRRLKRQTHLAPGVPRLPGPV